MFWQGLQAYALSQTSRPHDALLSADGHFNAGCRYGWIDWPIVHDQHNSTLGDGETIFMVLVNALFHPLIAGIFLAAILAAIMSTADSQLLVSSSALTEDFYKAVIRPDAGSKEVLLVGRIAVVVIALIALSLAMVPDSSVLDLVSYAWAGFGAAFGPVLILSLFWKRMNRNGALAGIIIGGVTVVVWKQLAGGLFDLYEIVPGMLFAFMGIYLASLLTPPPSDDILKEFNTVQAT